VGDFVVFILFAPRDRDGFLRIRQSASHTAHASGKFPVPHVRVDRYLANSLDHSYLILDLQLGRIFTNRVRVSDVSLKNAHLWIITWRKHYSRVHLRADLFDSIFQLGKWS
jgi:hypothetical protein